MLSSVQGQSGYEQYLSIMNKGKAVEVHVDDKLVKDCFYADEGNGEAMRYLRNEQGNFYGAPDGTIGAVSETIKGSVEIRLIPKIFGVHTLWNETF